MRGGAGVGAIADVDEPPHRPARGGPPPAPRGGAARGGPPPPPNPPGEHVGYGATFEADRPIVTGVVQLGYHDGIFRSFQDGGAVIVDGRRCPVVGRISMDSMVVDLSACPDVEVGTDVLVFGAQGESAQAIEDVAEEMGTIPYEVVARLGPRVQRVFVRH